MRTLLLDCNYLPVRIIHWQKAIILLLSERAEVVDEYENQQVRSVKLTIKLPKILRLISKHRISLNVKFTRMNVFIRDQYKCQYCDVKLPANELTFDHVIPVSKKGPTSWDNVVTCCRKCNSLKGCKDLEDTGLKLKKRPIKPYWSPELYLRLAQNDPIEWWDFFHVKSRAS